MVTELDFSDTRPRHNWLKSGLFWRTFVLLAFLIGVSMAAWFMSFRIVERTPRGQQIAAQIASIVTITRAAILHSAPTLRRELLLDLADDQGIRVYPREETDVTEPLPNRPVISVIEEKVRAQLGPNTQFVGSVNNIRGFWVSFMIEDDDYWLMLDSDRLELASGIQWLGWITVTLVLSLLGALFISGLINQPLARLSLAARTIAAGLKPVPLPEDGPVEIRDTNISFNQMARDLERIEADRTLILAGISHDLRTPIARMLLEVEMATLTDEARSGMQSDLAQMESIIAQFLDYAKPPEQQHYAEFDLSALLKNVATEAARRADIRISSDIAEGMITTGNPTEISRMLNNLIENARRYGKTAHHQYAELNLRCHITSGQIQIELTDNGTGLPEDQFNYLLQPFTRLDAARSQASGAGLGLAIVNRIIQRHQGKLELSNHLPTGLVVKIWLAGRSLN